MRPFPVLLLRRWMWAALRAERVEVSSHTASRVDLVRGLAPVRMD